MPQATEATQARAGGGTHTQAGVPAREQAALSLLKGAECVVHSASEVAVEVVPRSSDVVVVGGVRELQPPRPAAQSSTSFGHAITTHCLCQ